MPDNNVVPIDRSTPPMETLEAALNRSLEEALIAEVRTEIFVRELRVRKSYYVGLMKRRFDLPKVQEKIDELPPENPLHGKRAAVILNDLLNNIINKFLKL